MFTASHNPARYNGIKLCRAGAVPIGQDTGLATIRAAVEAGVPDGPGGGTVTQRELLGEYAGYLRQLVDLTGDPAAAGGGRRRQRHGRAHRARWCSAGCRWTWCRCTSSWTATSPTTRPTRWTRPTWSTCRSGSSRRAPTSGLAFDGDADRCFVVDEQGEPISPSAITALVAVRELAKAPGSSVIHNLITSQAVPEIVAEHGGTPVRTRVGHSFIKQRMAETGAVFGGEHSAHYYFRDFWKADSGMLAALHVLAALGEQDQPISELMAGYERYAASGEINSTVRDQAERTAAVKAAYAGRRRRRVRRAGRAHRAAARPQLVQPAPVQHRAAAAAERGGGRRRGDGPAARRGAGASSAAEHATGPVGRTCALDAAPGPGDWQHRAVAQSVPR